VRRRKNKANPTDSQPIDDHLPLKYMCKVVDGKRCVFLVLICAISWTVQSQNLNGGVADGYAEARSPSHTVVTISRYTGGVADGYAFYTGAYQIVPPTNTLQDLQFGSGNTFCFNATQTIIVAGGETTVTVDPGASITLIAGQNIQLRSGTTVLQGGNLQAYITQTESYCSSMPESMVHARALEENEEMIIVSAPGHIEGFSLFPNPTSGNFTLELREEPKDSPVIVTIYNSMGTQISTETIFFGKQHKLSLSGQPSGIYLVCVMLQNEVGCGKILRN